MKEPPKSPTTELSAPEPIALDAAERRLFAEALRRCEEVRIEMESALVDFGRWALVNVFDEDTTEALTDARANPVWASLVARAGGPTLRLSSRMLSVALHVAAYDKRINDEAWRGLDVGRKELLLPLGDDGLLRKAARRVTALKLTQRATRDLVDAMKAEAGLTRTVRLTALRLGDRLRRLHTGIGQKAFVRKVEALGRTVDDGAREALRAEATALREAADAVLEALKRKGE